jgi:hypothetical protein
VPAKPQPRPAKNSGNRGARQNIKTPHARQQKNNASQSLHVLSDMLKHQSAQLHATSRRLSAGQDDLTQVPSRGPQEDSRVSRMLYIDNFYLKISRVPNHDNILFEATPTEYFTNKHAYEAG